MIVFTGRVDKTSDHNYTLTLIYELRKNDTMTVKAKRIDKYNNVDVLVKNSRERRIYHY